MPPGPPCVVSYVNVVVEIRRLFTVNESPAHISVHAIIGAYVFFNFSQKRPVPGSSATLLLSSKRGISKSFMDTRYEKSCMETSTEAALHDPSGSHLHIDHPKKQWPANRDSTSCQVLRIWYGHSCGARDPLSWQ